MGCCLLQWNVNRVFWFGVHITFYPFPVPIHDENNLLPFWHQDIQVSICWACSFKLGNKHDFSTSQKKKFNVIDYVNLKMVIFLLGQQSGYTKYPCFNCVWDSWLNEDFESKKMKKKSDSLVFVETNVIKELLVSRKHIILTPLQIK